MKFPATSAPQYCLLSPGRRFVQFDQAAYPSLKVRSVLNRATGNAFIQNTADARPTWSNNAIAGTYSARNNPGALLTTAGSAGLTFAGGQYLEQDSIATVFATPESAMTVVCVVNPASSGGMVWSFADAGSDGYIYLSYGSGVFSFVEENSHGVFTASATVAAATTHVVTCIRSNATLTLRVDQVAGSPVTVTAGTVVPTTFCVGALNFGGSVSLQFNGSIGDLAVYGGNADVYQIETFLLQAVGVIRGPSSGINTGF
jgi:hypothetical protein